MIKNLPIICLTFFNFYCKAQNFSIIYGFPDVSTSSGTVDPSTTPTVTGVTFHSFYSFGASSNPSASGRFSFNNWPTGAVNGIDDYSTYTGVLSPTVYFEVSISVSSGYSLNLSTLGFSMRRSGTGIRQFCVRSNLDGYTNNLAASTGTATKLSVIPDNVFFWNYDSVSTSNDQKGSSVNLGSAFNALTQSVTFRFFAWNAESPGGSFSIDNVTFSGTVTDTLALLNVLVENPNLEGQKKLSVFPQPSEEGMLTLENAQAYDLLEVLSLNGEQLICFKPNALEKTLQLNLSFLKPGVYSLRAHSYRGSSVTKIIINHR